MPVVRESPRTTATTIFTCDRCRAQASVVLEVESDWKQGPPEAPMAAIPEKWRRVFVSPAVLLSPESMEFVFCQRGCMSTWLGEFVRRMYDEEKEAPARVSRRRRVQKALDRVARDDNELLGLDAPVMSTVES
jgi:hypothetical protein